MQDKRKFLRLVLAPLDKAFVWLEIDGQQQKRRIHDISYRGVGLFAEHQDEQKLQKNKDISIKLDIDGKQADAAASIKYLGNNIIGVNFKALDTTSRQIISAYMDPRLLGRQMKEVPKKMLRDKDQRLFLGPNNTRMQIATPSNKASGGTLEVLLLSTYVKIDKKGKVTTGTLSESFIMDDTLMFPKGTDPIKKDKTSDPQKIKATLKLLRYLPIEESERNHFETQLNAAMSS